MGIAFLSFRSLHSSCLSCRGLRSGDVELRTCELHARLQCLGRVAGNVSGLSRSKSQRTRNIVGKGCVSLRSHLKGPNMEPPGPWVLQGPYGSSWSENGRTRWAGSKDVWHAPFNPMEQQFKVALRVPLHILADGSRHPSLSPARPGQRSSCCRPLSIPVKKMSFTAKVNVMLQSG